MSAERYHQVSLRELSAWLGTHPDSWWRVDGDPILMGRVSFPCPTEKLAAALDRRGGTAFVWDAESKVPGPGISSEDLERLATDPEDGRILQLRWTANDSDWLLLEEPEIAEFTRRSAEAERR